MPLDPADRGQLFDLLYRHRTTLKHRFGQNFLVDHVLRDEIAAATGATEDDDVLEVGAGVGTLTIALARRARRVVAVELDRTLIPALREVVRDEPRIEVVEADILRYDTRAAFPAGGEIVAGNIPYNLTGALLRKLLDEPPRPRRLSLVVQKEVAERWTAPTGAGVSTIAVQVFAEARMLMTIPASVFEPQPQVDSALVTVEVRPEPAVHVNDIDSFLRFVEAVFQQRRKQLAGTLGRMNGLGSTAAAARLRDAGIDPERRPQTLSLQEWESVYRLFAYPS
ncbi:MAG TPA: 16S rRNA (adenine(1518)-N(6)/adenine(1519)-N(6))-dimethyltransferase RsmA [Candidatus Dormibacteraeota bacterium]|nr:16S rRNA (adenine(1518)-N(6)/adenine(1519)-N(6))-dimethyltransferase RsmA [Candidatus Dormibacteraeota bacterium]